MIKKITLASIATLALAFLPAQAEGMKCAAGKCGGAGMMNKSKPTAMGGHCNKMQMMGQKSLLLLKLPSPMRMIMNNASDPKLALTEEQKKKLESEHNEMMPKMMKLKEEIHLLSKEIKKAIKNNVPVADQKEQVTKLATLKTDATMMKLTCIEKIKMILSKEQHDYLKELRKSRMAKMKDKMQCMQNMKKNMDVKKEMKKSMKCAAGKCGSK